MNPDTRAYLRELAKEFNESTNSIRVELNRLTDARLLQSEVSGRTVVYKANTEHTLFSDIQNVVQKFVGIDQLVDNLITDLGEIDTAYIIGDYARGIDSGLIDIVVVGDVHKEALDRILEKTGMAISRKIRSLVLSQVELLKLWYQLDMNHALLVWGKEINIELDTELN